MALLASYYLPGLAVEDHAIDVPLDWRGTSPARLAGVTGVPTSALAEASAAEKCDPAFEGRSLRLFYRVVDAPENAARDLPYLVFLQGGPGGASPRLTSPTSDGWVAEAIKHFHVILPDQRGTGRSSRVDGATISREGDAAAQARFLKRFLADSIVRDFEYLRLTELSGARWVTLGQSYGGFLTLTYLSTFPGAVAASFTCGGVPHVPASADEVYAHTFPRMAAKTSLLYERYPQDEARLALVADRIAAAPSLFPDGSPLTLRRLQSLGQGLGMKPGHERLHNLLDLAFTAGDGSPEAALAAAGGRAEKVELSPAFLAGAWSSTNVATNPLYWVLQELIYADGELVLTAATAPETGRELVSSGRLCANARYNSVGYQPWYDHRNDVEAVGIAADIATYDHVNTNYWFYGHQSITDVTGMGNLHGVREMQHTFNSCTGLTEIDLSGLDPSSLEDLAYTFGGCGSLVTIWADADWALPSSGVSGFQTFYQCASLVGGAGTTYASSRAGYQYMRIDGADGAGYLTAKSS